MITTKRYAKKRIFSSGIFPFGCFFLGCFFFFRLSFPRVFLLQIRIYLPTQSLFRMERSENNNKQRGRKLASKTIKPTGRPFRTVIARANRVKFTRSIGRNMCHPSPLLPPVTPPSGKKFGAHMLIRFKTDNAI